MIQLQAIGRLGRDAEVKTLPSGKNVINFSIAVDTGWGDTKKTLWLECAKFGDNTKVAEFLKKGTQVHVSGEPSLREWESNTSGKQVTLSLVVSQVTLCGGAVQPKEPQQAGESLPF